LIFVFFLATRDTGQARGLQAPANTWRMPLVAHPRQGGVRSVHEAQEAKRRRQPKGDKEELLPPATTTILPQASRCRKCVGSWGLTTNSTYSPLNSQLAARRERPGLLAKKSVGFACAFWSKRKRKSKLLRPCTYVIYGMWAVAAAAASSSPTQPTTNPTPTANCELHSKTGQHRTPRHREWGREWAESRRGEWGSSLVWAAWWAAWWAPW
jgi:hypothetical protein